jgi:hypothetical protein
MTNTEQDTPDAELTSAPKGSGSVLITVITVLISAVALGAVLWFALSPTSSKGNGGSVSSKSEYPVGSAAISQPSGLAPPSANALPGYTLSYVNNFANDKLPTGWYLFTGQPGGDPGAQFAGSHVVISGGLLQLNTYKDPAFHNEVVTGGLCQCGLARTYGAYFVRSRVTGPGPNDGELLWPKVGWPPEIDFNENGGNVLGTSATLHFAHHNQIIQSLLAINMTEWHTWGVIWTPHLVSYVVDGRVWATVNETGDIPRRSMTLDLEQRTSCSVGKECPSGRESMVVDWVAEYSPK